MYEYIVQSQVDAHTDTHKKSNLAQWTVNRLLRERIPHYNRIGRKSNSVLKEEREGEMCALKQAN